jgi:hypothetical protein
MWPRVRLLSALMFSYPTFPGLILVLWGSIELARVAQGGAERLAQTNECFLRQIQLFALPMKDTPVALQFATAQRQSHQRTFLDFLLGEIGHGRLPAQLF